MLKIDRHILQSPLRVSSLLLAPVMLLVALYSFVLLTLNSQFGATLLLEVVDDVIPGRIEARHLEIHPSLLRVDIHGAHVLDEHGTPILDLHTVGCSVRAQSVFLGGLHLDDCTGHTGRALLMEDYDWYLTLVKAFTGTWRKKKRVRNPLRVVFHNMDLRDVDVLIQLSDMMMLFEGVSATGYADTGPPRADVRLSATIGSGRMIMSERMFALGPGKHSIEQVEWEVLRRTQPWRAAYAPIPARAGLGPGPLDLTFGPSHLRDFDWKRDDFTIGDLHIAGHDVDIRAAGHVRIVPERPKLPRRERGQIWYDGQATLQFPANTRLFDYFFPGLIDPIDGETLIEPITFDGAGNVRFYDGMESRLQVRAMSLLGWRIDEADIGLQIHNGYAELLPDSRVSAWGGELTGSGWMIPAQGTWGLNLCANDLRADELVRPFADPDGSAIAEWLDLTVRSTPATCTAGEPAGIQLQGDLTRKALEVAPAWTTPLSSAIQPPMLTGDARNLTLSWDAAPMGLPFRALNLTLTAALSQRGIVTLIDADGRPGLRASGGASSASVMGSIDTVNGTIPELTVQLNTGALQEWLGAFGVTAAPTAMTASASAVVTGPLVSPQVQRIRVTVDKPVRDEVFPDFRFDAEAHVQGGDLIIRSAELRSSVGQATSAGQLGLFGSSVFDLRDNPGFRLGVQVPSLRLGRLFPFLGNGATAQGDFRVSGTADAPRVDATALEVRDLSVFGEAIDLIRTSSASASNDGVELDDLEIRKAAGVMSGWFRWDRRASALDARLQGRDINLADFAILDATGLSFRGGVEFDVGVRRPRNDRDATRVSGSLLVRDTEVNRYATGDLALIFDTDPEQASVHVVGNIGADFMVDASVPLSGAPAELQFRFRHLSIADWWAGARDIVQRSDMEGELNLILDLFGDTGYSGTLQVDRTDIDIDGRRFFAARPLRVRWTAVPDDAGQLQQTVAVEDIALGFDNRTLEGNALLVLDQDNPTIDVDLAGDLDFSLLRFLPTLFVDAEGLARVQLRATGPLRAPIVDGQVQYETSSIAPRGLGTSILLDPGEFLVTSDRIIFPESAPLRGTVFGGEMEGWGEIGLRSLLPSSVDMNLFFSNVSYRVPEVVNVTLGGNARFTALELENYESWSLSGDIDILDGRFYQNFDILSGYFAFGSIGRSVEVFALPVWRTVEALRNMRADLSITGRDRLFVDSRVANAEMNLEMRTDLEIGGTFGNMDVRGEMEALGGSQIVYRGRTFETQNLFLRFEGDLDEYGYPMPRLESELISTIRPCVRRERDSFSATDPNARAAGNIGTTSSSVRITAFVEGLLPYELTFRLESTPFYDQRDQLSLILTGCTVDELTAAQAGAPTLDIVLRPVINLVERNVEERMNFDDVDLIPTTQGSAGILIQDEVSERFSWTLDATVGNGEDNRQIVRGSYKLFDWLIVEVQEQSNRQENIRIDTGVRFLVIFD